MLYIDDKKSIPCKPASAYYIFSSMNPFTAISAPAKLYEVGKCLVAHIWNLKQLNKERLRDDLKFVELLLPLAGVHFGLAVALRPEKDHLGDFATWTSAISLWSCILSFCVTLGMLAHFRDGGDLQQGLINSTAVQRCYLIITRLARITTLVSLAIGTIVLIRLDSYVHA
ncbi:hypothetical protein FRC02_003979 [Tulasnella sp. 418]|nr:hypothetical protein FRC02_003979 [Tulasnella sp. 418]